MGRKAKKGEFLDLDDPEEPTAAEAPASNEEPANVAKPSKKKGKKVRAAGFADDGHDSDTGAAAAAPSPAPKPAGKKQQKGKKGGNKFDFDSDDDKNIDLAPAAADSDAGDNFAAHPATKPTGKSKAKKAASAFDLLNEDDEQESEEPEDANSEDEIPTSNINNSKAKKAVPSSAFDLLNEDGKHAEDQDEENEEPAAKPSRKKGKKVSKDMSSLFAVLEQNGVDGHAGEAGEEKEAALAPTIIASKKKDKKAKKDMDSLFAALENGAAEPAAAAHEEAAAPAAPAEGKKKKKAKKDMDGLFAALGDNEAPAADAEAGSSSSPTEDDSSSSNNKKKGKKDKKDLSGLFATLDVNADSAAGAAPQPEPSPSDSASGKQSKKASKAAEGDEELAAILAELEAPKQQQQEAAAASSSKKKKKKGKGGAAAVAGDDNDIDALLAEIDGPKAAAADGPEAPAESASAAAEPAAADSGAADAADVDDADLEAAAAAGKELTAAQKKKLKKKQKEKEKKAAAAGGADEADTAAAADEAAAAAAAGGKKGKPVKESAAVRRMREQLEARQRAEEAAHAAEEARRKAEEEEQRRLEEEERQQQEEKERKKAAAKAKKEELKKQGKLLTGKAKAEAERLAAIRAQLLAQAADKGLVLDEDQTAAEAEKKPKKVVYASKKKGPQRKKSGDQNEQVEDAAALAQQHQQQGLQQQKQQPQQHQGKKQPEPAATAPPAAEAAAPAEQESDGLDDWEKAADSWEELDKSEEEPAAAAPAAAGGPVALAEKAPAANKAAAAAAAAAAEESEEEEDEHESDEDEESEEESESGSESDEEDTSSEEETSSDDDSSEYSEDSEDARERRIEEAREKRLARLAAAREKADKSVLRSPICCILGHVDVGKTKILDNIRRTNVQDGEAGGITQQIGATFVPADAIEKRTQPLRGSRQFDMKLPGLLVIDTPGHESFTNLRARGSGLCDVAVLIVDLMHGLEQQTIESINMLKMRKTPFIIAVNKCDRLYNWKSVPDSPIRDAFKRQKEHVMKEFEDRSSQVFLQLNEQGLNVSLYWKNPDPRKFVNVVPTSAITGEGIPDLLQLMVKLTQSMMQDRLTLLNETQCTVLEVKTMEGLGTTVDVVLVNGTLREGDRIVVCGLGGPIVTRVKSLKTPQVMKEMRVKGALVEHKEVKAAIGVKIVAPNLESAVAGTSLFVVGPEDDEEELKETVMEDMADIFSKVDKSGEGVCVQASTLGSLEALLSFLDSDDVKIAVSGINIGPVHKRDVLRANVMNEKGYKKFAVILAFDVPVSREARDMAAEYNVKIFTADIIYHLFDQFTAYMKQIKSQEQEAARLDAVFPCILQIIPTCVFNKKDPIVVGVEVVEGIAKVGTPLCVPTKEGIDLGRIASLELNHKSVDTAHAGQSVAMKIEPENAMEQSRMYGRHFDHNDQLVSRISRESINALKAHFADEMGKDDWRLVVKLKKVFGVQ